MKNLNKKIGVVVLSGLIVLGGGLGSKSVVNANSQHKSKHESRWELAPRPVNYSDVSLVKSNRFKYKYHVSDVAPDKSFVEYISPMYPKLLKPKKYFINPQKFFLYLDEEFSKLEEDIYLFNIRGVDYLIQFDHKL